jgi:hypothetical protein
MNGIEYTPSTYKYVRRVRHEAEQLEFAFVKEISRRGFDVEKAIQFGLDLLRKEGFEVSSKILN